MEDVREAIGIDKVDLSGGSVIFIEEHHNADANFLLHAVTSHCRDKNNIACLVLFHSTFGHFHNVGMKLGYNLRKECNSSVRVVEPLKIVSKNIHSEGNLQCDNRQSLEFDVKTNGRDLVKRLAEIIKAECVSIEKETASQKVYVIIDDLSHLFDIGLSIQDVWLFIRYIRTFAVEEPLLTFCISSHVYKANDELCKPNLLALGLRYSAELLIIVQPLETGYSRNVSGKMTVCWKLQSERLRFKWPEEMVYLYKLSDRQVKLFAPGSSHVI